MEDRQSYYVGIKGVYVNEAGAVLILKDAPRAKWEVPGGRIDKDQSILESFNREIQEEIPGASVLNMGEVVHVAQGDFIVENDHKLLLIFYRVDLKLPENLSLSDEHTDTAWVNKDTLADYDLFSTDKAAIVAALS